MQKIMRIISGTFVAQTTAHGISVLAALPIMLPKAPQVWGIKRMYALKRRCPSHSSTIGSCAWSLAAMTRSNAKTKPTP